VSDQVAGVNEGVVGVSEQVQELAGQNSAGFEASSRQLKSGLDAIQVTLQQAVAAQSAPTKEQREQLNFLRFSTILIDELSISLRKLFVRKWDETYPDNTWAGSGKSGAVCWDGSELNVDLESPSTSAISLRCMSGVC
jgi:hypothetical protein